jgi:hypothetical protein
MSNPFKCPKCGHQLAAVGSMCPCQTGGQSVLYLPIKRIWFDMVTNGKKTEEYRAYNPYWISRIEEFNNKHNVCKYVELRNGYGFNVPRLLILLVGIDYGFGRTEWGAPKEKVFILKLGEIIWIKNWKGTV